MRKVILLVMAVAAVTACKNRNKASQETAENVTGTEIVTSDAHTSRNSLDYAGTYKGTLPCADCSGIETTIKIDADGNFERTMTYLGKGDGNEFKDSGTYEWNSEGSIIELKDQQGGSFKYLVGENRLVALDQSGNVITGELADYYVLTKQQAE